MERELEQLCHEPCHAALTAPRSHPLGTINRKRLSLPTVFPRLLQSDTRTVSARFQKIILVMIRLERPDFNF